MIWNINIRFVIPTIIAALTVLTLEGLATVSLSNDGVPSSYSALAFHTGPQGGNVSDLNKPVLAANNYINEARQALQNGNITIAYLYLDQAQDQLSILSSGDAAMSIGGIINAPGLGSIAQPGSSLPQITSTTSSSSPSQTQQPTEQVQSTTVSPRQEPPDLEPREPPVVPQPKLPPD